MNYSWEQTRGDSDMEKSVRYRKEERGEKKEERGKRERRL
jgi:hypothetical protein